MAGTGAAEVRPLLAEPGMSVLDRTFVYQREAAMWEVDWAGLAM
jgi:hypothetical protein